MEALQTAVAVAVLFAFAYSCARLLWDDEMPNVVG